MDDEIKRMLPKSIYWFIIGVGATVFVYQYFVFTTTSNKINEYREQLEQCKKSTSAQAEFPDKIKEQIQELLKSKKLLLLENEQLKSDNKILKDNNRISVSQKKDSDLGLTSQKLSIISKEPCRQYGFSLRVVGGEIDSSGDINLSLIQTNLEVGFVAIINPSNNTYLTDEMGNKYPVKSMDGIDFMDIPDRKGTLTKFSANMPQKYTITFHGNKGRPKLLNFTSTYFIVSEDGSYAPPRTASCTNIKIAGID